jgi:hypothetical protein
MEYWALFTIAPLYWGFYANIVSHRQMKISKGIIKFDG